MLLDVRLKIRRGVVPLATLSWLSLFQRFVGVRWRICGCGEAKCGRSKHRFIESVVRRIEAPAEETLWQCARGSHG